MTKFEKGMCDHCEKDGKVISCLLCGLEYCQTCFYIPFSCPTPKDGADEPMSHISENDLNIRVTERAK